MHACTGLYNYAKALEDVETALLGELGCVLVLAGCAGTGD